MLHPLHRHDTPSMQADDRAIREEGIENLTADELRSACRARGMRYPFGEFAVPFMRQQLEEWLDLSLNRCAGMWEALLIACAVRLRGCVEAVLKWC